MANQDNSQNNLYSESLRAVDNFKCNSASSDTFLKNKHTDSMPTMMSTLKSFKVRPMTFDRSKPDGHKGDLIYNH